VSARVPWVVFDLDGTLVDSDRALIEPYLRLGFTRDDVRLGPLLVDECARLGITVEDYLASYDESAAKPFPGVEELVAQLDRWAVCSNKHARSGRAELARLGWRPDAAFFADAFGGPKRLEPVLAALDLDAGAVLFVGDTAHDRACAAAVGCPFVLAGWNPRAAPREGDLVASTPAEVLDLFG
jgi:HAD superfamily hydrolase (TIGR01549 family)